MSMPDYKYGAADADQAADDSTWEETGAYHGRDVIYRDGVKRPRTDASSCNPRVVNRKTVILGMLAAVSVCGVAYVSTNGGSSATPDNIDNSLPVGSTTSNSTSSAMVDPDDSSDSSTTAVKAADSGVNLRKKGESGWESPRSYGWWGNHGSGPKPVFESTEATTHLLSTLHELNQVNTIGFGQQYANYVGQEWPWFTYWGEYDHSDVFDDTGDYPLVFGYDLEDFFKGHDFEDYIIWAADKGAIITFSWLARNPLTGGDSYNVTCGDFDDLLAELMPGGELSETWKAWLDTISEFLDRLTFEGGEAIPVVFRLFHEGTADWYWWGTTCSSATSYKAAYEFTAKYLHNVKGHENILWEYAPSKPSVYTDDFEDRYPGDDLVDIISFDRYAENTTYDEYLIDDCVVTTEFAEEHNKVSALAETGIWEGIEYVSNPMWYETKLLEPLMKHCPSLAYALTYTNFDDSDYWVPLDGQTTYPGFMEFYEDEHTMFLNDTLWQQSSYYSYIKGLGAGYKKNNRKLMKKKL